MLFGDIGIPEVMVILVGALFIFGPDRLPKAAAQAVKILRELRGMANGARTELGGALGPELADLTMNLRDLDPRAALSRALMDDGGAAPAPASAADVNQSTVTGPRKTGPVGSLPTPPPASATPFDAEAT